MEDHDKPLADARILVPPSRPEVHPLLEMLKRRGAWTRTFPRIQPLYPSSWASLDEALRRRDSFDWIVFAGSNSVHHWIERAGELGFDEPLVTDARVAAIGHGAVRALRVDGRSPDHVPRTHVAEEIASGLPGPHGARILLVRVEGSTDLLPEALRAKGARITTADGYQMAVSATAREARSLIRGQLDLVALASPTALRVLERGATMAGTDLHELTLTCAVAAAGPATARAAEDAGLVVELTGDGRLADLTRTLVHWWQHRPLERRPILDQGEAFLGRFADAGERERAALRTAGAELASELRSRANEMGYSRATEFSPKIRQYQDLASEIEALVNPPGTGSPRR